MEIIKGIAVCLWIACGFLLSIVMWQRYALMALHKKYSRLSARIQQKEDIIRLQFALLSGQSYEDFTAAEGFRRLVDAVRNKKNP